MIHIGHDITAACAQGMVYPKGDGMCHNVPLRIGHVKVQVDLVKEDMCGVPLPVPPEDDILILKQAKNYFIQWPKIGVVLDKVHNFVNFVNACAEE